ncbi:MAG: hypothetical protein R2819_05655 [Allomuricauda sp.]
MTGYQKILDKLNGFTKKYYTKRLIKGSLLFLAFGLLFWIAVMSLEYLLWLGQRARLVLFLAFLLVEAFLVYRFIMVPLVYLFRLKKGITHKEASRLIGKHFPQVDDKLVNLLDLAGNKEQSELLLASIDQRANDLGSVPFTEAIDFKESIKYAKYVVIPLGLLGFIWISGNIASFLNSHERVMHFDLAYERPAPFTFKVLNDRLEVMDNEPLLLKVAVEGGIAPENVFMVVNGEELLLKKQDGLFTHTFEAPVAETSFHLTANGWNSRTYTVTSFNTPALVAFQMALSFPKYLHRNGEVITGTGNATIPEGTLVTWKIKGNHVESIGMKVQDSSYLFGKHGEEFTKAERIFKDLKYELSTSNAHVKDFEKLVYAIDVIKDDRPTVKVEQFMDSLNPNQSYYTGQAADDYGISKIRLVCYPEEDTQATQRITLESPNTNVHQFYYTFPSGLRLQEGKNYKLYFEIVDNDGIRGGKITRSQTFSTSLLNNNHLIDKELEFQNSILNNIDNSLEKLKEQKEALTKINDNQKEERTLSFEDKNEIKDFLRKQEQQEQLMEKFSKQLKESLDKNDGQDSELQKMLQERLERQEIEARKNEKLLEELNELADKIDQEELKKRLEELGKKQGNNTRNLEQILELTKRYYVTEKAAQLAKELEELAEKQQALSELKVGQDFSDKDQEKLNGDFEELAKQLKELGKDNQKLQKPLELDTDQKKAGDVKQDQKDALEEINKRQDMDESSPAEDKQKAGNAVSKKQKSAAQKMQEMSQSLQQGAMGGGGSSETEDAEMLRQILDNLVTFSFKQENLFDQVESADVDISQFSKTVREQKELRRLFEHVDDSLFALSLRRAELSEFVNEQITEVYYNIDKSLESISESQIYQGASYQQYVMNATNALADFLANILDNMQQNMSAGQGNGSGSDFQLPDIIQGQEDIQEKMQGAGQEGKDSGEQKGQEGEGKEQGDGNKGNKGTKDRNKGESENSSQNKDGNNGEGEGRFGQDEMGLKEVYEIYKEQQYLRQQLEKQLENMINTEDRNLTKKLLKQMEDFENELLENGITERTMNKVNTIQHELLKLENATLKQGVKKERESNTNQEIFTNPITTRPELLKEYQNSIEILNRQALPLRQNYEKKVKVYFKND